MGKNILAQQSSQQVALAAIRMHRMKKYLVKSSVGSERIFHATVWARNTEDIVQEYGEDAIIQMLPNQEQYLNHMDKVLWEE